MVSSIIISTVLPSVADTLTAQVRELDAEYDRIMALNDVVDDAELHEILGWIALDLQHRAATLEVRIKGLPSQQTDWPASLDYRMSDADGFDEAYDDEPVSYRLSERTIYDQGYDVPF